MSAAAPANISPSVALASSPAAPVGAAVALAKPPALAKPVLDTSHTNLTPAEKRAWTSKQIIIAMTSILLLLIIILSILGITGRSLLVARLGQREKDEVAKSGVFSGINMVFWTCIIIALIAIAIMYVFATGKIAFPDGKAV